MFLNSKNIIGSTEVIGTPLSNVDYERASEQIIKWSKKRENRYVCVCNVHSTTSSHWDPTLRKALQNSDMNTADGMPLVWMQRLLGTPKASRVYGPTLMLKTLEKANKEKLRIAFYGGHPDRMPELLKMIRSNYPNVEIASVISPPFRPLTPEEDRQFTTQLKAARPNIIWVGIGCPKQENWMLDHSHRIPGVMIGVGAAFDFHAGAVEQAPAAIQKLGLEWAFRLSREPKRLFKRYLQTNPVFLFKAAQQLTKAYLFGIRYQSKVDQYHHPRRAENLPKVEDVAICIATYQRPFLLKELLFSIHRCKRPDGVSIDIRVVDNDADESSRAIVEEFKTFAFGFNNITYHVEPRQNIAHARNSAIELGRASAYIFVDDDETVSNKWLVNLINAANNHKADGVFGPVQAKLGANSNSWQAAGNFFEKQVPKTGTRIDWRATRTSNTLINGIWFHEYMYRFDAELGRSGGSDTNLFAHMDKNGADFIGCREAIVEEFIPENRATFNWLWKRAYRNGLIYERNMSQVAKKNQPLLRAIKRCLAATLLTLKGLPSLLKLRPAPCIKGLLKIPLMLGGLHATIRPSSTTRHVAYQGKSKQPTKRVAFLTNIISPYRKPVFENLARADEIELKIFVDAESEFDRNWDVETNKLPIERTHCISWKQTELTKGPTPFTQRLTKYMPYGIPFQLKRFDPEVVISLELGLRTAFATLYCKLYRKELIIWCYQSRVSANQSWLRKKWRQTLLHQASTIVGMGKQAREVLIQWGVSEEKIIDAPNASDQENYLQTLSQPTAERHIHSLKEAYAPDRKLAIVVGRLIPLKGIEQIITAWNALPTEVRAEWKLVFVGTGPLAKYICSQNPQEISLADFVSTQRMPYWYAAADLHIFPTCGDVWGLVVNEASICGTPTLCSEFAGCFDDLINDGETGFKINFSTSNEASQKLQSVLQRDDLDHIGLAAQSQIRSYTPENMAHSFKTAITAGGQT